MGVLSPAPQPAEVHVLLLDDLLLLLQRQDERFLLKSHSRTLTPTPDGKTMLRPVLRLTSAMTREVATGEAPGTAVPRMAEEPSEELGAHALRPGAVGAGEGWRWVAGSPEAEAGRGDPGQDTAGVPGWLVDFIKLNGKLPPGVCTEELPVLSSILKKCPDCLLGAIGSRN